MGKLKWPVNREQHAYMKRRQMMNLERATKNQNERWMHDKLMTTSLKWTPQAQWGYRLYDFWNHKKGIAIEVDGAGHDISWDKFRDEYNYQRSGILVLHVRNGKEEDAEKALEAIAKAKTWNERRESLGLPTIKTGGPGRRSDSFN